MLCPVCRFKKARLLGIRGVAAGPCNLTAVGMLRVTNRCKVRFVEYGEYALAAIRRQRTTVAFPFARPNRLQHIDLKLAMARQYASRRQNLTGASDHDRHNRQVTLDRGGESAETKTLQARLGMEGSFREQGEGFAGGCRPEQVPCIPRTGGSHEPFHEARADPAQQEMRERYLLHLTLDDERETGRQESLQDQPVQVAGMIGDHDAVPLRNPVQSGDA